MKTVGVIHEDCNQWIDEMSSEDIQKITSHRGVALILATGGVGGILNALNPSLTLGCGSRGKNITNDEVTARHLLNVQRIARRLMNSKFFGLDPGLFLDEKVDATEVEKMYHRNT